MDVSVYPSELQRRMRHLRGVDEAFGVGGVVDRSETEERLGVNIEERETGNSSEAPLGAG
jgi:hypothetical protein